MIDKENKIDEEEEEKEEEGERVCAKKTNVIKSYARKKDYIQYKNVVNVCQMTFHVVESPSSYQKNIKNKRNNRKLFLHKWSSGIDTVI